MGMKSLPKLLFALTGVAVTSLLSVQPSNAYTVALQQMGSDVVATGSGAINLTGLSFLIPSLTLAEVNAGGGGNNHRAAWFWGRRPIHWIYGTYEFRERGPVRA